VWEFVSDLMKDPAQLREDLERMIELEKSGAHGDPEAAAKAWLDKLAEVDQMRGGFQEQVARGYMTFDELGAALNELAETRRTAERELAALQSRREALEQLELDKEALLEHYARIAPEALDSLTLEERHSLYKMLRLEVLVRPDSSLEVSGVFGEAVSLSDPELVPRVPPVVEAVLAHLGEGDLAVHHHPVADADAQIAGEELDASAAQDLPAVVPEVIHPEVGHVAEAAPLGRRGYAADQHDLPGLHGGQLGERVLGREVQQRDRDARRRERRPEHGHQSPFEGHEVAPQKRRHRDDQSGRNQHGGEGRRYRADGDPGGEQEGPQVQSHGRAQVEVRSRPRRWQRVRSSSGSLALFLVSPPAYRCRSANAPSRPP
jgi:hypothetical protein